MENDRMKTHTRILHVQNDAFIHSKPHNHRK